MTGFTPRDFVRALVAKLYLEAIHEVRAIPFVDGLRAVGRCAQQEIDQDKGGAHRDWFRELVAIRNAFNTIGYGSFTQTALLYLLDEDVTEVAPGRFRIEPLPKYYRRVYRMLDVRQRLFVDTAARVFRQRAFGAISDNAIDLAG